MNTISEKEMWRRLKLIRDIRIDYVNRYGIQKDELNFSYPLLNRFDEAEYVEIDPSYPRRLCYGKYEHEKTITHWDATKDSLYNRGEIQGYWGDIEIIRGAFKTEIGNIIVSEEILTDDCSDQRILEIEQKEFRDLIRILRYRLSTDLNFRLQDLDKLTQNISGIKDRLKQLEEIVID